MRIDVYYDLICPWCYIGFHRFRRALGLRPELDVHVVWHPFQLNPSLPPQGTDQNAYLRMRYGSIARARRITDGIAEIARRDGLPIDLESIKITPNSTKAHQFTLYHAAETGTVEPAIDALMRAHCAEGRNVGLDGELAAIGRDLGLSPLGLQGALNGNDGRAAVRARDASARRLGIQAVPSIIIDDRFSISGAQEPSALLPLLDAASIAGWFNGANDYASVPAQVGEAKEIGSVVVQPTL